LHPRSSFSTCQNLYPYVTLALFYHCMVRRNKVLILCHLNGTVTNRLPHVSSAWQACLLRR
jgi:hypothetical protein